MLHCPIKGPNLKYLNSGRVEHNTDLAANSLRRQVLPELCPHNADTAVGAVSLTPDNAIKATLSLNLGLVDICKTLSEVELSLCLGLHTVNLNKGGVVFLSGLTPLKSQEVTGHIKSANKKGNRWLKYIHTRSQNAIYGNIK
jgi:hypothetical protein